MESNRFFASFIATILIFGLSGCGDRYVSPSNTKDIHVDLDPVELDARHAERATLGRLELMGAFDLSSSDSRFGGLSGLAIGADGRLYAISDRGLWLSARMHLDPGDRLLNLTDWQIAPLLTPKGTTLNNRLLTDAEGLARAPDGSFIVAFEHVHRLWRYGAPPDTLSSPAAPVSLPRAIFKAPRNGGIEAVSILPGGRIFVIAEEFRNADESEKAWLLDADSSAELSYSPARNFAVSDATALNNGDVVVLERRFGLPLRFSARLTLIKAHQIRPGAALKGEELLRLEAPLPTDNFEGVAAMETGAGTMIFVVSDDNYFLFQRTLLLQFLLPKTEN